MTWLGWIVVALLAVPPEKAAARTDFDRMEQLAATDYDQSAVTMVKAWRAMIEKTRTQSEYIKVENANNFINHRIMYESDMVVWGQEDYWTTPLELFGKRAGDCEDFAIAKYISLLLMDIPMQKLRLVYARARIGGPGSTKTQAHMVLSYFETPTTDPLILDNMVDAVSPASRRSDLFPVFSFNHEGLWMEGERRSSGDPSARLSRWRDVLQRMRREGIDPSLASLSIQSLLSWKIPKYRVTWRKASRPKSPKIMAKSYARPQKTASHRTASKKFTSKMPKSRPSSRKLVRR